VNAGATVAIAAGGYLIGSIQFARIVFAARAPGEPLVRIRTPTKDGEAELVSHAVGATNVMIAFGPRWGMFVTALDILKAFVPVLALRLVFPDESYALVCGGAVLVGHLWPVWYRFRGGGGNSSIIGMLLAISPVGAVVTHAGGMVLGRLWPVLAFVAGVALTIPWFWWRDGLGSPEFFFAIFVTVVYVAGQLPEAVRIYQLKREGHTLDMGHVMALMRGAARTGRTGAEIAEERRGGAPAE
jgi:glycerol-3-phosphate acyltransferase PlsY